ncbi:hydroxymethylbilane synthase [uncultured Ruminococcus sp.]|uniref:hydroxymethylbilane synthase n=1 Tax=uncultured Ruminococcus sp. TaxID=165186 RepID=UPI002657D7A8|nr:hydroxymethylbilane synthase [uncultured Ruminococcus sp.]
MGELIRIGSRASRLAIIQSQLVMAEIQRSLPDARLELVTMKTTGDKILNRTLDKIGGKGLFLKELDNALLSGEVDLCVHSLKDVPVEENPALPIGAYSAQESPGDVLVLPEGASDWDAAAPVGCASLRRSMQFQQLHPDVAVRPVRGNVLTRLEKLDRGEYGALILAEAGLKRLDLSHRIHQRFSPEQMVPAAGQGVMVTQSRAGEYAELLKKLNHPDVALCSQTERCLSALLGGDCSAPVGCHARCSGTQMTLYGFSGMGGIPRRAVVHGQARDAAALAEELARQLA